MFTVILLIMPMKMLNTQRRVQSVLEAAAKELSQYAYVTYRLTQGDSGLGGKDTEIPEGLFSLFSGVAAGVYLNDRVEKAGEGAIENLNFMGSEISKDGEMIRLEVSYRLKLPFSVFILDSVPAVSRSFRRGWIGSEGGRASEGQKGNKEQERMVYVGNSMGRYHLFADCHYISNDIIAVSYADIENYKSVGGTHYTPCSVCKNNGSFGGSVYVMPNGSYYHSREDCSSVTSYVRQVSLSEVESLGECSYCRRMKGE